MRGFTHVGAAAALLASMCAVPAFADDSAPGYTPGPWHFKSVSCVETKVAKVQPRATDGNGPPTAADFKETGVIVSFDSGLGLTPVFPKEKAAVVHYQQMAGNDVMTAEKPGDAVQLCFLSGPAPTIGCDPDTDDRGRMYRVWDYEQKKQYAGANAEHLCGGA